ncbi:LytR/AlgR family response regulator transcription factor [Pedobacter soli]|uniref:Two component transcriptional regulator, LytTR family n=1 Tax=Pedobacter soli TaxID=390242 RepID=A0A1G6YJY1_9SPHI|nr:LytTR family DNA-binding domain-containing protein [Pedobacter soli]SDD90814.1 two component transcriptional regulator, LytTR family [Pedobacter soli]
MNCLIVDDHAIARRTVSHLLQIEPSLKLVAECENASEAYRNLAVHKIDLLLLDIEMPGISGIELVKGLGEARPLIIFISAKKDHAAEAFDLNVVDFITKPITPDRFLKAITKAKEVYNSSNLFLGNKQDDFVFIRDAGVIRRIRLDEINYLEAQGDYVKIYQNEKTYAVHSSLKSIEEKLPAKIFIRVHRSFIVNIGRVDTVEGSTLIMHKNFVPVSDAYKATLNKRMQIL